MQNLYLNPNDVVRPSPVPGFSQVADVDPKTDVLMGYVVTPFKKALETGIVINTGSDCSDPTHIAVPVTPPMAISAPKPVFNHCGQLIGYIGSVVKNSTNVLML